MKTASSDNGAYHKNQSLDSDDTLRVVKRRRKSINANNLAESNSSVSPRSASGKRVTSLSTMAKQFFFRKVSSFLTIPDKTSVVSANNSAGSVVTAAPTAISAVSRDNTHSPSTPVSRKRPSMSLLEDSPETPPSVYQAVKISNRKKYCSNNKRRNLSIKTSGTRRNNGASFFSTLFRHQHQQRDQQRQQEHEHQKQQSDSQPNLDPPATDFITKVNSSTSSTIISVDSSSSTVNDINYFFEDNDAVLENDKDDEPSPTGFTPITPTVVLPAPPLHTPNIEHADNNAGNQSGRKLTKSGSDAAEVLRPALPIYGAQQYMQPGVAPGANARITGYYDEEDNDYTVVGEHSVESCWSCNSDSSSVLFLGEEDVSMLPNDGGLSCYSSSFFFPPPPAPVRAQVRMIQIPEIVSLIVEHVDAFNPAPQEQRRSHDHKQASPHQQQQPQSASENAATRPSHGGTMFSCLLVNKLWYTETRRILYKNIHFRDDKSTIDAFLHSNELPNTYDNNNNNNSNKTLIKPKSLVLHKTSSLSQAKADRLAAAVAGGLEWLELYTCPQLMPSVAFATGGQLRTLILPGCAVLTDSTLGHLARASPLLETLDLRACEQISDKSIRVVAHYCPRLAMLNVGRTRQGHRITNKGIRSIARHTQVCVLGVAGCHITDTTVWELALHRGPHLERVSLNNCILLTNASVPKVLGYIARSLSVIEVKNLPLVTDLLPFVMFKRYRQYQFGLTPLIEGCERFDERLREAEYLFEMEVSKQIFSDTLEWIYAPDDDIEYISID